MFALIVYFFVRIQDYEVCMQAEQSMNIQKSILL